MMKMIFRIQKDVIFKHLPFANWDELEEISLLTIGRVNKGIHYILGTFPIPAEKQEYFNALYSQ
jgi:hypothetical protein